VKTQCSGVEQRPDCINGDLTLRLALTLKCRLEFFCTISYLLEYYEFNAM
jgi:hypothetical protein